MLEFIQVHSTVGKHSGQFTSTLQENGTPKSLGNVKIMTVIVLEHNDTGFSNGI